MICQCFSDNKDSLFFHTSIMKFMWGPSDIPTVIYKTITKDETKFMSIVKPKTKDVEGI